MRKYRFSQRHKAQTQRNIDEEEVLPYIYQITWRIFQVIKT